MAGLVIYSNHPRREYLFYGLSVTVLTAAGILLPGGLWPVSALLGLTALGSFTRIVKASSVTIEEGTDGIILTERSIAGQQRKNIPLEEISGTRIKRKGILFRRQSARLVLLAAGLDHDLGRFPTESARFFLEWMHCLSLYRHMPAEPEPEPAECKAAPPAAAPVRKLMWAMLEMSVACPGCRMPVPVNGLLETAFCGECGLETHLTRDDWGYILKGVRRETACELEPGTGSESMIMAEHHVSLLYASMKPYCPLCKEDFQEPFHPGQHMNCGCGGALSVREAPPWLKKPFKGARLVAEPGENPVMEKQPVTVTCNSCGAPFGVKGRERNPSCPACGTHFFVGDDLWHHFNPVPVVRRWYIGFMAAPKGEPQKE